MKEIYLLCWSVDENDHHALAAFSSKEEAVNYIEQNYPSYEYDDYCGEQWNNTKALIPEDDCLYIMKIKFIK